MKKNSYRFFLIFTAVLFIVLAGCNKSDDAITPAPTDPSKAKDQVSQGNQLLIPVLSSMISSQGKDTATSDISAALSMYQQALNNDPNNLDAHFGYAATTVLNVMNDPDMKALFNGSQGLASPLAITFSKNISARSVIGSLVPASVTSGGSGSFPQTPLAFYQNFRKGASTHPFSYYQDIVETKFLPLLSVAISHLQVVSQNPSFAMYITNRDLGGDMTDSIRIDLTEVYLLLACLNFVDAAGSFATAYNIDYTPYDSVAVLQAWQAGSPFLAFRSNGSQRMKDAKSRFLAMTHNIQDGINYFISQSTHPGIDLIKYNPNDRPSLINVIEAMDSVQMINEGPYTVAGNNVSVTFDLAKLFDNAISDYKTKIPAYTVSVQQSYDGVYVPVLTWQATSFSTWLIPDPTMNGFFPGMTDGGFKTLVGLTAQNWTQQIILGDPGPGFAVK